MSSLDLILFKFEFNCSSKNSLSFIKFSFSVCNSFTYFFNVELSVSYFWILNFKYSIFFSLSAFKTYLNFKTILKASKSFEDSLYLLLYRSFSIFKSWIFWFSCCIINSLLSIFSSSFKSLLLLSSYILYNLSYDWFKFLNLSLKFSYSSFLSAYSTLILSKKSFKESI